MHSAGVKFPPPFIHLSALLVGGILEYFSPISGFLHKWNFALRTVAGLFILLALGIIFAAAGKFKKAQTNIEPWKPTTALVTHGPYARSRNPIYLSFSLIHAGLALGVPSMWIFLTLVPAVIIMRILVIAREERYLEKQFGKNYLAYKNRVPRWF